MNKLIRQFLATLSVAFLITSCDARMVKFVRAEYPVHNPSHPHDGCKMVGEAAFIRVGPTVFQISASAPDDQPARISLGIHGIPSGTTIQFQSSTFSARDLQTDTVHVAEPEDRDFLEPKIGVTNELNKVEAFIYSRNAVHTYYGVLVHFPEWNSTDWELQVPDFTVNGQLRSLPRIRFTHTFGVPHREHGFVCD